MKKPSNSQNYKLVIVQLCKIRTVLSFYGTEIDQKNQKISLLASHFFSSSNANETIVVQDSPFKMLIPWNSSYSF